jgi:hypothetical protein
LPHDLESVSSIDLVRGSHWSRSASWRRRRGAPRISDRCSSESSNFASLSSLSRFCGPRANFQSLATLTSVCLLRELHSFSVSYDFHYVRRYAPMHNICRLPARVSHFDMHEKFDL